MKGYLLNAKKIRHDPINNSFQTNGEFLIYIIKNYRMWYILFNLTP